MAIVLLVAALFALPSCAGAAKVSRPKAPPGFFGVMADGPLLFNGFDDQAEFDLMDRTGVQTVRMAMPWSIMEPKPGQLDFSASDTVVARAAGHGFTALPTVTFAPDWAARHPGNSNSPPEGTENYANFIAACVRRYGTGGSFWSEHPHVPVRPVRAPRRPAPPDPLVAGLERAQPAGLQLVRPAVRRRLRGAAASGPDGDQGRRPRRAHRARRPRGHELDGAGPGLQSGRPQAVRRGGDPPVHARAAQRAEDPAQGPGGDAPLPRPPQADVHHRADVARGQGRAADPHLRLRGQRRAAGAQARPGDPAPGRATPGAAARARLLVHVDLGRAGADERPVLLLGPAPAHQRRQHRAVAPVAGGLRAHGAPLRVAPPSCSSPTRAPSGAPSVCCWTRPAAPPPRRLWRLLRDPWPRRRASGG